MIKLYNTLTRQKNVFKPLNKEKVLIYVCGITPYDTTHLGHAFVYISFDVLIRYLKYKNYDVLYTQNVTDINDRDNDTLKRAREQNITWQELSRVWTNKFLEDMQKLNWTPPANFLFASSQIKNMINLITVLLEKRLAYKVKNSVYLDISKDKEYGKLSKISQSQMLNTAKEYEEDLENLDKKNPLDITLWRGSSKNQQKHIPSFKSPFGWGRPGWHIECSAMAISSLGMQIDIHGGGRDLIYPHHENEIFQSEGATGKKPFASIWMHTGIISYGGEKMSKSLGNLVMVSDLLKSYSPNAVRWMLLSNHYRNDWDFTKDTINKASREYRQVESVLKLKTDSAKFSLKLIKKFESLMDDDLNVQLVLVIILDSTKKINILKPDAEILNFIKKTMEILGFVF